jgi:thioredoxin 1
MRRFILCIPVIRDVQQRLEIKQKSLRLMWIKPELADAKIKGLPTLMIYKEGQMIWRQSGELDTNTLIGIVQEQL